MEPNRLLTKILPVIIIALLLQQENVLTKSIYSNFLAPTYREKISQAKALSRAFQKLTQETIRCISTECVRMQVLHQKIIDLRPGRKKTKPSDDSDWGAELRDLFYN